jgi:small subunit ribosomal protein S6
MTDSYYETMYILRPDIPEEEVESHVTRYREIVSEAGGQVLDTQMRGKRRLAYPIAKHREGIYVQLNHDGDGQQVAPLERAMRLSEDVIRYLTVKQSGPMPAPRSIAVEAAESAAPPPVTAAASAD